MKRKPIAGAMLSGALAGLVTGLLGGGGGMILIPVLNAAAAPKEDNLFPSSICVMLSICLVSIVQTAIHSGSLPWQESVPYLFGSAVGGFLAGISGRKIPVLWLHRGLGLLIFAGGVRSLC